MYPNASPIDDQNNPFRTARLRWSNRCHRFATSPIALLVAIACVLRIAAMIWVPLIPEEAYYWMYAQHPALSYFDHPPMVAWVIRLGTVCFGDTEFGVRCVNGLLMFAACGFVYLYGRAWFGRRAGAWAGLSLLVLPLYFIVGFVTTMDAALLCFWALTMLAVTRALKDGRGGWWYLAGVGLGASMLSKYTGVFLAAGTFMAIVGHRDWRRRWLTSVHPYLALLLAAGMFAPVVIWNYRHDWASFRFQFVDRYADSSFDVGHVLTFLGFQLLALTPVLACGAGAVLWRIAQPRRRATGRWWITLCFSLPLLLATAYKSLRYDVHINWTLPAYLALLPAMASLILANARLAARRHTGGDRAALRPWRWSLYLCAGGNIGIFIFLLFLQPSLGWLPQFGPWKELAAIVEQYEDRLESDTHRTPLIIADGKYRLASVLAFYRKPMEGQSDAVRFTTNRWMLSGEGLGFKYWTTKQAWHGADCIYVANSAKDDMAGDLHRYFGSVRIEDDPRLAALGQKGFGLATCRNLLPASERPVQDGALRRVAWRMDAKPQRP